jgi:hypothetical protein
VGAAATQRQGESIIVVGFGSEYIEEGLQGGRVVAQSGFDTFDGPARDLGSFGVHGAAQFNEGIEDTLGGIDGLEDEFLIGDEGEGLFAGFGVDDL